MIARGIVVRSAGETPRVEDIELDAPGPGEVRVRVLASGVCHSDLHAQKGDFGAEFPYLLGHEATGVIEEVGPGVAPARVGETVVLTWRAPCGRCRFCAGGQPVFCARPDVAGPRLRTRDGLALGRVLGLGTFATHTVVHERQAIPVAADLSPAATCLIGCGVATGVGAALFAARMAPGSTAAVFGLGAVGMSVVMGARLASATRIVAVDVAPGKLELARRFGATDVLDAREGDVPKRIKALLGAGVRYAFEAVGLPETLGQALASCDLGGTCVLIGVPTPKAKLELPLARYFYSRVTLLVTFGGDLLPARDFPVLADWYRKGTLDLDGLVTRRIGLDDLPAAFSAMERGEVLRSVIELP